jgi:hypothetical protein
MFILKHEFRIHELQLKCMCSYFPMMDKVGNLLQDEIVFGEFPFLAKLVNLSFHTQRFNPVVVSFWT